MCYIHISNKNHYCFGETRWRFKEKTARSVRLFSNPVYRNLAMFLKEGQVISVGTVDGQERYDARTDFHAHLVCRRCRCVTDIEPTDEVKTICEALARSSGCKPDGISLSYTGLCRNCLAGE